ncbi:MAG: hypothetical protein ACPG1C_02510 [Alphaproteobacteria bacterium]
MNTSRWFRVGVIIIGAVLSAVSSAEAENKDFYYVSGVPGDRAEASYRFSFSVDEAYKRLGFDGTFIMGGDAIDGFYACPKQDPFYCVINHRNYVFAVPRAFDADQDAWVHNGFEYKIVERDVSVKIFGNRIGKLVIIRTPPCATLRGRLTGKATLSLYSPETGVVGITREPDPKTLKQSTTLWLNGEYGLGHSGD